MYAKCVIRQGLLILVSVLGACTSSVDPYPAHWPPLPERAPEQCVIRDGFYAAATAAGEKYRSISLSTQFGLDDRADLVELRTDGEGALTVAAIRYGEIIGQRRFDAGGSGAPQCRNGWLLFDSGGWHSGQAGAGYESAVLGLLFVNGHLIVKTRGSFVGWVYIMPMAARGQRWGLYPWLGEVDLQQLKQEALERQKRVTPY
ncbi:hypothetical protein FKG94_14110 [Exilibacterium tricleocarpae]|uniref:Lipoprotein n=1 Tax=Exilibacterium tricleocarpae TaxID=2591008 RepID=A0A545TM31_9GAMM|nr:hypothetical protein [Exilibacterium tricleocarpae]TQV78201.1 hypothetical protein FKG94_14110 [Exilibacterium tricleocarpae]